MDDTRIREAGRLATVVGVVAAGSAVCLGALFAVGEPFGRLNDIGNAATGVLSAALAWRLRDQIAGQTGIAAVGAAVAGAAVTVAGSALVVSGTTGFFLAGLVSSVGFAGIGLWLVALNRSVLAAAWPRGLRIAGLAAGSLMALGIIAAPAIVLGLDDMDSAPGWVWLAMMGWLGTFVVYPIWAIWAGASGWRPVEPARARALPIDQKG